MCDTGLSVAAALVGIISARAAAQETEEPDLTELSLEDLMNLDVEVTSVDKRPQRVSDAAAAVTVLTAEEILRSGATSIPEALRLVPGLNVAQISANTWAISSRGFNGQFDNKLLVLIDGRSVYTPLFSGVYWDVQDLLLENIERIEVIRGPGATVWGANAVNGVINIITRSARDTVGGMATVSVGSEAELIAGVSYGVALADAAWLRVWGKWTQRDGMEDAASTGLEDDWDQGRIGFRADGDLDAATGFTVQGSAYRGTYDGPATALAPVSPFKSVVDIEGSTRGEYLLARMTRQTSSDSDWSVQAYYDRYRRDTLDVFQRVDTIDLDFDQHIRLTNRDVLLWGAGYRRFSTGFRGTFDVEMADDSRTDDLVSAFVQDVHTLVPERLLVTLGSKFEINDFTGFEVQPNVRLTWKPDERQTLWCSVARSVRTPSIVEDSGQVSFDVIPGLPATVIQATGSTSMDVERLVAWEAGWRVQPADNLSFDLAVFLNDYTDLQSLEPGTPVFDGTAVYVPLYFANGFSGRTWGTELAVQWSASDDLMLRAGYAFLAAAFDRDRGSADTNNESGYEESFPSHQAIVRAAYDLSDDVELDCGLAFVDQVEQYDADAYVRGDVRLGFAWSEGVDLSLIVHGLFHHEEREFGPTLLVVGSEPEAGALLRLTVRF